MNRLDTLKRDAHAHNLLRSKTYVLYSTPHLFGKRTFIELVPEGIGSARLKAHEWTLDNGDTDGEGRRGRCAEFCLLEDWCVKTHGSLAPRTQGRSK